MTGAKSVAVGKATVELPPGVTVGRGLDVRVEAVNNSGAAIVFGNLPILQVDRATGASKILNVVGDAVTMTGYNITSKSGLLNPDGLAGLHAQGVTGWEAPNPKADVISEINLTGEVSIAAGQSIDLGNAYNGGATKPADEDVVFQFSNLSGDVVNGFVEYTGPANEFVANVNPATGEISLYNLSKFIAPIEVTGYQITSASESLDVSGWTSIASSDPDWTVANPKANSISELSLTSSKLFENPTVVSLGNIFKTDGLQDIKVQYTTLDDLFTARVEYGELPIAPPLCDPNTQGDINGDKLVNFADFQILSTNFGQPASSHTDGDVNCNGTVDFADFQILSTNFGKTVPAATAASVPEPSGIVLLSSIAGLLVVRRRRSATA